MDKIATVSYLIGLSRAQPDEVDADVIYTLALFFARHMSASDFKTAKKNSYLFETED